MDDSCRASYLCNCYKSVSNSWHAVVTWVMCLYTHACMCTCHCIYNQRRAALNGVKQIRKILFKTVAPGKTGWTQLHWNRRQDAFKAVEWTSAKILGKLGGKLVNGIRPFVFANWPIQSVFHSWDSPERALCGDLLTVHFDV